MDKGLELIRCSKCRINSTQIPANLVGMTRFICDDCLSEKKITANPNLGPNTSRIYKVRHKDTWADKLIRWIRGT